MSQEHFPDRLIKQYPVSKDDMKSHWGNNVYNVVVKKKNWRTCFKYNVVCRHENCVCKGWNNRINMASFNKHCNNIHGKDSEKSYRIVSFWEIENITDKDLKRMYEYRLIDIQTLEYIGAQQSSLENAMDINMNTEDNVNLNNNNWNVSNINSITVSTNSNVNNLNINNINHNAQRNSVDDDNKTFETVNNPNERNGNELQNENDGPSRKRQKLIQSTDEPSTNVVDTLINVVKQLSQELKVLKKSVEQLEGVKTRFEDMAGEYKCNCSKQSTNSTAINSMESFSVLSETLKEYVGTEGKKCWSLEECKDEDNLYFLQCKLCSLFIKNKDKNDMEHQHDRIESIDEVDKFKKRFYAKGQFVRGEDIENKEYFKNKLKSMKKHETKNKRHVAVATIMLEELDICTANILTKTEIGYELFSRAEPDTLYPKLLRLVHRIGKIADCRTEIGSYG
eukprot:162817_1